MSELNQGSMVEATYTQASSLTYHNQYQKVPACQSQSCKDKKFCSCFRHKWAQFNFTPDFSLKKAPISFSYDLGVVRVSGLEVKDIKNWKQLHDFGAQEECAILNRYSLLDSDNVYQSISLQTENNLKIIKIPTSLCIIDYEEQECKNSLASTSFYNSTCNIKMAKMKVTAEAIQNIFIIGDSTYNHQKPTMNEKITQWFLPDNGFNVTINIDDRESNKVQFFLSQQKASKTDELIYTAEIKKKLHGKERAVLKMRADYQRYKIQIGFLGILVGDVVIVNSSSCGQNKVVNINDVSSFCKLYNVTQEISIDTPGNVTAGYYTTKTCSQGKSEDVCVKKEAPSDLCGVRPKNY